MWELALQPEAWASLLTLTALEIVLGIDNVLFLAIITDRLPPAQRPFARRFGLMLALLARLALLASVTWLIGLSRPIFDVLGFAISWRDIILLAGGLFLLYKATAEMHAMMEAADGEGHAIAGAGGKAAATMPTVIAQIVALDLVFSLDSVLTAIGMTEHVIIMVIAVCIAIVLMLVAADPLGAFVSRHPTVKMLGLAFLLLVGVTLLADGLHFHFPRGYLYFAIAFSAGVEGMNLWLAKRRADARAGGEPEARS